MRSNPESVHLLKLKDIVEELEARRERKKTL
jgi:hypothetical protein